ncbi:tail sheath protein [Synechococcus phage DSL-LC03]|nr:tail sheath protein [Synechococcus phage DSL-LC03]
MALGLVSPGVKIREVDLTIGRAGAPLETIGGLAGPFEKGPIDDPVLIENEQQLIDVFGKPSTADGQYEYWYSASNYLSYGGALRVIRSDSSNLGNANSPLVGSGSSLTTLKIKNFEDYSTNYDEATTWYWAAKHPGVWANGVKVCSIDNFADQTISGINTTNQTINVTTGVAVTSVTTDAEGDTNIGIDTTGLQVNDLVSGEYIISGTTITAIGNTSVTISNGVSNVGFGTTTFSATITRLVPTTQYAPLVGAAVTQSVTVVSAGVGTTSTFNGYLKGVITGVGNSEIYVKVLSTVSTGNTETTTSYGSYKFSEGTAISIGNTTVASGIGSTSSILVSNHNEDDWYDQQTLNLSNSVVYWNTIAPKPGTSVFASNRSGLNDEIHVVVVDDLGSITGIAGNILEKWVGLSKASDAQRSPSEKIYYKEAIANTSNYLYAGAPLDGSVGSSLAGTGGGNWQQVAQGVNFNVVGNKTKTLLGGNSYGSRTAAGYTTPEYSTTLGDVINSYQLFTNIREFPIDFLLMGSGWTDKFSTQAKANALISIASTRKDCMAVISPHRAAVVDITNTTTQTNNVIDFYDGISSTSYAVFDSGYKYMFDRFNNKFVYVPLNADIAGCMCRTTINDFSWFSPAGSVRGVINSAVKLAYNPSQAQRDQLYVKRINPVIYSPGSGIILFGDKTGLAQQSAFDRINVRRLFITIESNLEAAARDQLFEFNDTITRSNFLNIVEPYLRDVQAKRGINDFLVICDETNNTPDVIDANEFRADIFIKPARSINFIGLTFIATRTGVSFEEVAGRV